MADNIGGDSRAAVTSRTWKQIQNNYCYLVANQEASNVLDYLYQEEVFTEEECQRVRKIAVSQDQNREFFSILKRKPHSAHEKYLEGLDFSGQELLANEIRSTTKLLDDPLTGVQSSAFSAGFQPRPKNNEKEYLSQKLTDLLCLGENKFRADTYPYLVCNAPGPDITKNDLIANFKFLQTMRWKAIFEFETDKDAGENSICSFMDDELEMVTNDIWVDQFDPQNTGISSLEETIKNSEVPIRFFVNGYGKLDKPVLNLIDWKLQYCEGFREALRFISRQTPKGRAVVMFILLSNNYSVMLEAAEEFLLNLKFRENWILIAESDELCERWKIEMQKQHSIASRETLDKRCISGMPWSHVNATIHQLIKGNAATTYQLTTSTGARINLSNKVNRYLIDLDILGCNECTNTKQVSEKENKEELKRFESEIEQKYYRGEQVSWWNFFFKTHVLKRDIVANLHGRVLKLLTGNVSGDDEDLLVGRVNLFHQPGAGGTTVARQILWELKEQYRCVSVKHITEQTILQLLELYSYEDTDPKPLLILLDKFGVDEISELMKKLVYEARQLSKRSSPVIFVVIVCSRKVNCNEFAGRDPNTFVFPSKLSLEELSCFGDKYKKLEKEYKGSQDLSKLATKQASAASRKLLQFDPKNLISFNILKENFNPDYIRRTVQELTDAIVLPCERRLLKYIALLNAFDLFAQPLPIASFDRIMSEDLGEFWESNVSEPLKILLNHMDEAHGFGKPCGIRIISVHLAKEIFGMLTEQNELEGDIMLKFLESEIFCNIEGPVENLMNVVRILMKDRLKNANGTNLTHFSPLVQTIVNDRRQSTTVAANVLIKVFNLSKDVMVAQHIARLYIFSRNWPEATKYGELITTKIANNSFLWDTFAQVFKGQLLEEFHAREESNALIPARQAMSVLEIAFRAITIFREGQRVSKFETSTTVNNAGYYGEIETIARLLDYMLCVEGLNKVPELRKFLTDIEFVPEHVRCWKDSLIDQVKNLHLRVQQTYKRLDSECMEIKPEYRDEDSKKTFRYDDENLRKHRECIDSYLCEDSSDVPKTYTEAQASRFYRRRIQRLRGNTLRSLFIIRNRENGKNTLLTILGLAERNVDSRFEEADDLCVYIGVSIALWISDHKNGCTPSRMATLSTSLYNKCDIVHGTELEPYMFAFMFNWPTQDLMKPPLGVNRLPEVMEYWKNAFIRKYPRKEEQKRKETTFFFLANGTGMDMYLHEGKLHEGELQIETKSYKDENFWKLPILARKLQQLFGVLRNQGNVVSVTLEQEGNKFYIDIPTSLPQRSSVTHNKRVSFYLGFSWCGPKAYNVKIKYDAKLIASAAASDSGESAYSELGESEWKEDLSCSDESKRDNSPQLHRRPAEPQPTMDHLSLQSKMTKLSAAKEGVTNKLKKLKENKQKTKNLEKEQLLLKELKAIEEKQERLIQRQKSNTDVFRLQDC